MMPDHLVQEVRYIELRTRKRLRSPRAGGQQSALRGDGFDFEQHRPYRPGDDVRRIDWHATARAGAPFVRQTRADRELQVVVAVDLSRSMQFGSEGRSKHEALVLASAALLFAALEDRLSAGVVVFAEDVVESTGPVADREAAWAALRRVWTLQDSSSRTLMQPAIEHLLRTLKRTTLVFMVSDFQTNERLDNMPELIMLAARHDVVAIVVEDRAETRLPSGSGFVRFRDLESGRERVVGLTPRTRRLYEEELRRRRLELRNMLYRAGVAQVMVDPREDVLLPIMRLFDGRNA
ncbi:MAG: DUF58 domain-containing protein [Vicinamibacterales bacterium]